MKKIICANSHDHDIKTFRKAGYDLRFDLDTAMTKARTERRIIKMK